MVRLTALVSVSGICGNAANSAPFRMSPQAGQTSDGRWRLGSSRGNGATWPVSRARTMPTTSAASAGPLPGRGAGPLCWSCAYPEIKPGPESEALLAELRPDLAALSE